MLFFKQLKSLSQNIITSYFILLCSTLFNKNICTFLIVLLRHTEKCYSKGRYPIKIKQFCELKNVFRFNNNFKNSKLSYVKFYSKFSFSEIRFFIKCRKIKYYYFKAVYNKKVILKCWRQNYTINKLTLLLNKLFI